MTALLEAERLAVDYPTSHGRLRALEEVSLALAPGETVGVIGESGSGKTTLGRALAGLVRPRAGEVRFRGRPLASLDRAGRRALRRAVALVFQDPAGSFDPRRTIGESVAEPLTVHEPGLGAAARAARVLEWLARVGLEPAHAAARPRELSGGQCQRAALARAMIAGPELVICDEAVSALDVSVQAGIVALIAELARERGVGFLFISHQLAVVRRLASRVLVLYHGRVLELAPREALFGAPRHPYTRLLLDSAPSLDGPAASARLAPPDASSPFARAPGCPFAARCPHVEARCRERVPPLERIGTGHEVACLRQAELEPR
ncbi:MAG: ABC transporter ATP-binding protein [Proteobacteria bacterium]|nr:ABC transporter ATP-binding protein [Pseudomonadota bacterium]